MFMLLPSRNPNPETRNPRPEILRVDYIIPVQRFQGGLVFKAHRLLYHSNLGLRVIKKKKN